MSVFELFSTAKKNLFVDPKTTFPKKEHLTAVSYGPLFWGPLKSFFNLWLVILVTTLSINTRNTAFYHHN